MKKSKPQLLGNVALTIFVLASSAIVMGVYLLSQGLIYGGLGMVIFVSLFTSAYEPGVFIVVALIGASIGALSVRRWVGPAPRRYVVGYVGNLVMAGLVGVAWLWVFVLGFVSP